MSACVPVTISHGDKGGVVRVQLTLTSVLSTADSGSTRVLGRLWRHTYKHASMRHMRHMQASSAWMLDTRYQASRCRHTCRQALDTHSNTHPLSCASLICMQTRTTTYLQQLRETESPGRHTYDSSGRGNDIHTYTGNREYARGGSRSFAGQLGFGDVEQGLVEPAR